MQKIKTSVKSELKAIEIRREIATEYECYALEPLKILENNTVCFYTCYSFACLNY